MSYQIKEAFYTLQGEGFHTGRPAIFCRFTQCNLWTGRESDRAQAVCQFCDTDFIGTDGQNGGRFESAASLVEHLLTLWPSSSATDPFVVLTGGEPLLQVDQTLVDAFHDFKFEIALETNGTKYPPKGIDWVCVSPKANAPWLLTKGDELKLVFPQPQLMPDQIAHMDQFKYCYLQPMDGENASSNIQRAVTYCLTHPQWRLSLQTHKILGID
ncbi:organic radical-activating protein [Thiomicrospira aerophila AL3]|uniref:7-carboxy-7-deazaguanine synthase n=1 Tax=Thiomicrospira aerophila AL3 TaxID=717772 RepID=W0DWT1_9GAMM|nr:7-carboxy-7-deazaguanine synthase [Thiomicrospira aerophila]AHF01449.1 organic radical-activating protein [Thiomicrospira aerophila AL3]